MKNSVSERQKVAILNKLANQSKALGHVVSEQEALKNTHFKEEFLDEEVWGSWDLIARQLKSLHPELASLATQPKTLPPKKRGVGEKNG
jgi:hypothetical protein